MTSFPIQAFRKPEDPAAFAHARFIRETVFIQEQNVPAEEEFDAWDETALHFLVLDAEAHHPCATARISEYPEAPNTPPVGKIGRVAVLALYRGKGLGHHLINAILTHPQTCHLPTFILDAQTAAIPFYEKLGFHPEGPEFLDAGIPHRRMRKAR